jgi:hypothetical protein
MLKSEADSFPENTSHLAASKPKNDGRVFFGGVKTVEKSSGDCGQRSGIPPGQRTVTYQPNKANNNDGEEDQSLLDDVCKVKTLNYSKVAGQISGTLPLELTRCSNPIFGSAV